MIMLRVLGFGAAFALVLAACWGPRAARRLRAIPAPWGEHRSACGSCTISPDCVAPTASMVLELLAVSLKSGASIPRALDEVAAAVGRDAAAVPVARGLHAASVALLSGAAWTDAWAQAGRAVEPSEKNVAATHSNSTEAATATLSVVASVLEPAWRHGSSPIPRIEAEVDRLSRRRADAITQAAAGLSTGVLIPLGLCFLPAFILLGIIPVIAGWGVSFLS